MWHQSALEENPEWPKLKHTSWSYVIYPWQYKLPFMAVESYLWYKATSDWYTILVSYTVKSGSNVYEVCTEKTITASYSKGYWCVTGHHWGDYPSGYTPSKYDAESDTGWVYIES